MMMTTPIIRGANVSGAFHPWAAVSAHWKPIKSNTMPLVNIPKPTKSKVARASLNVSFLTGFRLRKKKRIIAAAPPVGRFIQKHHLHERCWARIPPTSGPRTLATPHVALISPPYFPRSSRVAKKQVVGSSSNVC